VAKPTHELFLKDVADHAMTIVRDDGLYRHLVFAEGKSWCMRFEVITWPGYLCYTGDMGAFVFSRIEDMFAFFRDDKMRINPEYWSEKIQATDRNGGHKEWSEDKFRSVIECYLTERSDEPASRELRQAVEEEVLSRIDDGQYEAYRAASEFEHDGFRFDDLWDHRFDDFTYRFIWCCYALVWGIEQYDKALTMNTAAVG
jgi:hypothetical protein